jgi:hypothetical protein
VKLAAVERHCCELFVADLDAGAVALRVVLGFDAEPRFGGRGGDELDNREG